MPSFTAREPLYVLPDGSVSHDAADGARCIAGRGHVVTDAMQRKYGIDNPDLAQRRPAPEPEPPAAEEPQPEPVADAEPRPESEEQ